MIFNSLEFVCFFALFFPIYFLLPDRWRTAFLVAASYYFYAVFSVKYLCLLLFTMGLDYVIALGIDGASSDRRRKALLVGSVVANLGILFVFKYFNLFSSLFATLAGRAPLKLDLILPFGISFYTFHAMSYTIDVYRRTIRAERDFMLYSGYVMFFPQLVAGPIARASHLLHQFAEPKRLRLANVIEGSYLIAKGYLFKVVLADSFGVFVDACFSTGHEISRFRMIQASYFFAFQIYADFAGYTLIACGIARLLDFRLVENFRTPYFATSITDFWRRWHISLSTWLRDYLYISLGGNRGGRLATYRNLMLTMLLGGLWHGSQWTFLVWGGLHGLYLVGEKALGPTRLGAFFQSRVPVLFRRVATFHLVLVAWVFFRAESFSQAGQLLGALLSVVVKPLSMAELGEFFPKLWLYAGLVLGYEWLELRFALPEVYAKRLSWPLRFAALYAAILIAGLFAELNTKAFIYFQF